MYFCVIFYDILSTFHMGVIFVKGVDAGFFLFYEWMHFFITPRSRFDNTLNFDITLTLNLRDCVVISLDINFYASVTFRLHFSMSN